MAAPPSAPRTPPPPPRLNLEPLRAPAARGTVAGARRTHTGKTTDIGVGRETGTGPPGCACRSYGPGLGETGVGTIMEDSPGWSRLGGGGGTERASETEAPLVLVVTLAAGRRSAGGMQTPSPPPPWGQDGPNGHVGGHPPSDPTAGSRGAIAGTYANPNPHPPPRRTAPARSRVKGGLGGGFGQNGERLRRGGEPRLTAGRRQAENPHPGKREPPPGATPPATPLQRPRLLSADSPIITAFLPPLSRFPIS